MSFSSGLGGAMTGISAAAGGAASSAGLAAASGAMQQTEATSAAMTELTAHADQMKLITDAKNGVMNGVMDTSMKAMSGSFAAVKQLNY